MESHAKRIKMAASLFALVLLCISPVSSEAEPSKILCSSAEAVACGKQGECARGPVDQFNLPLFFEIDFANKVVDSLTEEGTKRHSLISGVESMDGYTMVLGTDVDSGWSLLMNEQTGKMTLGVVAPDEGYTIFGACVMQTN